MTGTDVDLNLLRVLDALLQEGSVRAAAERLHVSAPAVSRSLGRLRHALGDPLFVRAGRTLVPTALAVSLQAQTHRTLVAASTILSPNEEVFDPGQLNRRFIICAADAVITTLGISLVDEVTKSAPGVEIDFLPDTNEHDLVRTGLADLDIGAPHSSSSETESEILFQDNLVVAFGETHAFASHKLSVVELANARHLVVSTKGTRSDAVDSELARFGRSRDRVTVVPSFVVAAHLIADSDAIAVLPSTVVTSLGTHLPITAAPLPFAMSPLRIGQTWHLRHNADPAHRWLRSQVAEIARRTSPEQTPEEGT